MTSKITAGIPTKNRYDCLSHTLLSIAFQTIKPIEVIIVDDSDTPTDLRELSIYNYIFKLFDEYKIEWKVLFGQKKGQHFSHQLVQSVAKGDYIFRCDDDVVLEPSILQKLYDTISINNNCGAVAPLVLSPNSLNLPTDLKTNSIHNLNTPNIQWFNWKGEIDFIKEVDHLYSTFLYKKGIENYNLSLSTVAHREETIFTYGIKRKGFKLLVNGNAKTYHFRQDRGGIRSQNNPDLYQHDEKIFQSFLNLWDIKQTYDEKIIILDSGIGDHFAFKNILPSLKERHKKILIYCCYPDVFFDEKEINLKSIQEAKMLFGNIDAFNIYSKMIDWGWKENIVEAYKKLYL